jgi:hypothetical protein
MARKPTPPHPDPDELEDETELEEDLGDPETVAAVLGPHSPPAPTGKRRKSAQTMLAEHNDRGLRLLVESMIERARELHPSDNLEGEPRHDQLRRAALALRHLRKLVTRAAFEQAVRDVDHAIDRHEERGVPF